MNTYHLRLGLGLGLGPPVVVIVIGCLVGFLCKRKNKDTTSESAQTSQQRGPRSGVSAAHTNTGQFIIVVSPHLGGTFVVDVIVCRDINFSIIPEQIPKKFLNDFVFLRAKVPNGDYLGIIK